MEMRRIFFITFTALLVVTVVPAQEADDERLFIEYLDNNLIAAVKGDGTLLEIIDSNTGKTVQELPLSRTDGMVSALLVTNEEVFIGTSNGYVFRYISADKTKWRIKSRFRVSDTAVTSLAYQSGTVIAGDKRGKITELNPDKGYSAKSIGGHAGAAVIGLGILESGELISMADDGINPRVWSNWRISGYLNVDGDTARALIVSRDRKKAAVYTAAKDKASKVYIFSGTKREKIINLPQDMPPVVGGTFSPDADAKYILLATMDGGIILNTKTEAVVARQRALGKSTAAWRPDNFQYVIYNGDKMRPYTAPERPVGVLKITSDADAILLINGQEPEDGGSISAGVEKLIYVNVGKINLSLKNDPNSKIICNNKEIKNVQLHEGETVALFVKQPAAKQASAPVLPSGKVVPVTDGAVPPRILRPARDGSLILADFGTHVAAIEHGKGIKIIANPSGSALTAIEISPDKRAFYLGDDRGLLRVVDATGEKERQVTVDGAIGAVEAGTGLVAITAGTKIYFVDPDTARPLRAPIEFGAVIPAAALHGDRLIAGGANGNVGIINTKTGQIEPRIVEIRIHPVTAVSWIGQGGYFAVSYNDGLTLVYNSSSGTRALPPIRGTAPVRALTASENGSRLSIIYEHSVETFDMNTGKAVQKIPLEKGNTAVHWLAENKLAVGGANGIEFYTGTSKTAEFLFYPSKGSGVWTFVTMPEYSFSSTYYEILDESVDEQVLTVKLYSGNDTRPLAADDRKNRDINQIWRSL
jgi:WD40 repeat protein